jgi:hypothetical protein
MAESQQKHLLELGIEFLLELLLFLYPYGADQMGLPHNFWLGLGCWVLATVIAVRMIWIFPVWSDRLSSAAKGIIALVLVAIFVAIFFRPVLLAYYKRNGDSEVVKKLPDNKSPESPAPEQPAAKPIPPAKPPRVPSIKKANPIPTVQSGNNNAAVGGGITQGPGSIAQVGGKNNIATINNGPPPLLISHEQQQHLTASARPFVAQFAGKKLNISLHNATTETAEFGDGLDAAFQAAGFQTNTGVVSFVGAALSRGVTIRYGVNQAKLAEAIRDSLLRDKVVDKVYQATGIDDDDLLVIVAP